MSDKKKNNEKIKRIIDPKSGFSLYIRKFNDSEISQVSTLDTFPIPDTSSDIGMNHKINDELKSTLTRIETKHKKSVQSNQELITKISKQNKQLKLYILALITLAFLSILV